MRKSAASVATLVPSVLALIMIAGCARDSTADVTGLKAFTGASLMDGTGASPIANATLLVRNGRIEAVGPAAEVRIPSGAERIDLTGKFLIPGLINAHGHAAEDTKHKLGVSARYGTTTLVSLGGEDASHVALRDAQDPANLTEARFLLAGQIQEQHAGVDEARAGVRAVKALGADWVKARVADGNMAPEVYGALIDEAHAQGLKVAVHIYTLDEAKGLLRAGVDVLGHSIRDQPVDEELIGLMRPNEVCLIPTLTRDLSTYIYESVPGFFSDPFFLHEADPAILSELQAPDTQARMARAAQQGKSAVAMAQHNLKAVHDAGLLVAMGTDSGAFSNRFVGYFEHLELQLMAEAGLTPMQIIQSATSVAADCMDIEDTGSLVPGKWADFLVLAKDPLEDIANTTSLEAVWMAGEKLPALGSRFSR